MMGCLHPIKTKQEDHRRNLVTETKNPDSVVVTWLMTSSPQMWHEKIFWGKFYLFVVWHSSRCKIVKVIKLFKKIASKDSGIIIIYFYNYSIQELDQNSERFKVALYNLTADPYERNYLSIKYPDVVSKLKDRMQYYINSTVPPINKPSGLQARKAVEKTGFWGPWQD